MVPRKRKRVSALGEYKIKNQEKTAEMVRKAYQKVEDAVVGTYKKIENGVVDAYQRVEDTAVGGYKKIEQKFVDTFLEAVEDGNTPQQSVDAGTQKSMDSK